MRNGAFRPKSIAVLFVMALLPFAKPMAQAATRAVSGPIVTITDEALQPVEVCVARNRKVTWVNAGSRTHRVTPDQRPSWTAFALGPGRSKSIQFSRVGRHPYRVDGSVPGLVRVASSCESGGSGGASGTVGGTAAATTGNRTYRYDIEVRGFNKNKNRGVDNSYTEDRERTYTWSAAKANIRVDIRELAGYLDASSKQGEWITQVKLEYRYLSQDQKDPSLNASCSGAISGSFTGDLQINFVESATTHLFHMWYQATSEGGVRFNEFEENEFGSKCKIRKGLNWSNDYERFGIQGGFEVEAEAEKLLIRFTKDDGARPGAADLLLRGAAFSLESGPHVSTNKSFCPGSWTTCESTIESHYEMIFTPSRGTA